MRPSSLLLALPLLLAVGACDTARQGMGELQKLGDQGIEVQIAAPSEGAAPDTGGKIVDQRGRELPEGLLGDTINRKYEDQPPAADTPDQAAPPPS